MGVRAQRKKAAKTFKVGDSVTWGNGSVSHPVVEVSHNGVYVDATSAGFGPRYFVKFFDKRYGLDCSLRHAGKT